MDSTPEIGTLQVEVRGGEMGLSVQEVVISSSVSPSCLSAELLWGHVTRLILLPHAQLSLCSEPHPVPYCEGSRQESELVLLTWEHSLVEGTAMEGTNAVARAVCWEVRAGKSARQPRRWENPQDHRPV